MIILQNSQDNICLINQKELAEKSGLSELSILRHILYLETLHWIKYNTDKTIVIGETTLYLESLLEIPEESLGLQTVIKQRKLTPYDVVNAYKTKYHRTFGTPYPLNLKKELGHVNVLLSFTERKIEPILEMIDFIFDNHEKIQTTWLKGRLTLVSLTRANIWAFLDQLKSEGFKTNNITDRYKENNSSEVGW